MLPHALAFDASGNLFVANYRQHHGERVRAGQHDAHRHPHRAERSRRPGLRRQRQPLRRQHGNNTVSEFAPGSTTPTATLTGLNDPSALAFDASGNLFVANTATARR